MLEGRALDERQQITYMQARISRMAHERWGLSFREIMALFAQGDALGYIERNFGLLHLEGDESVFDDVTRYLRRKGVALDAVPA